MNAIIVFTIVSTTLAHYIPNPGSPNVGTVLFASSDLNKTHWSRSKIALLQARKFMQSILPSPHLGSIDEKYITDLLKYFEKSYKTVKRETKNPYLCNMMDVAISDALGGYLKIWVLPIAKYSYYGGVLSLDKCLEVFNTYEDIKRSLKTQGHEWRSPNKKMLESIEINVLPPPSSSIRKSSMNSPCKELAYYVKTDDGMKIPMPHINWDISPPTMFLPLVNQSIISISSPSSSSTLLRYYTIANECTKSEIPKLDDFYDRFEKWLIDEVTPHLNDDKFYAGFGSILSLMHSTKRFCGKQIHSLKESISRKSAIFTSKFLIITLILLLELLWCIPTVKYTLRLIRKKRIERDDNGKRLQREHQCIKSLYTDNLNKKTSTGNSNTYTSKETKHGLKFYVEPKTANLEIDLQSSNHDFKNMSPQSGFFNCDLMTVVDEKPPQSPAGTDVPVLNTTSIVIEKCNINRKTDLRKTRELKSCKTFTLVETSEKSVKDIRLHSQENVRLFHNMVDGKCNKNNSQCLNKGFLNITSIEENQNDKNFKKSINKPKTKRKKLNVEEKDNKLLSKTVVFSQTEPIIEKDKWTATNAGEVGAKGKEDYKLRSSNKPMLSIFIERPKTSIKLGITSYKEPVSTKRPSKIPRAVRLGKDNDNTITTTKKQIKTNSSKANNEINETKTCVTRLRGIALDDSAIKKTYKMDSTSIYKKNDKLNVTL